MNHSQVRVAPILIREPARWDIGPHFLHQSWLMLGVHWGEELRSRTSPWKVAGQLRSSILIFWTISKCCYYRKIVSFVVGLLYSILIPMYSVSSAIFQRGTAQPTWSPTHPLNCSLSLSLPSSASGLPNGNVVEYSSTFVNFVTSIQNWKIYRYKIFYFRLPNRPSCFWVFHK